MQIRSCGWENISRKFPIFPLLRISMDGVFALGFGARLCGTDLRLPLLSVKVYYILRSFSFSFYVFIPVSCFLFFSLSTLEANPSASTASFLTSHPCLLICILVFFPGLLLQCFLLPLSSSVVFFFFILFALLFFISFFAISYDTQITSFARYQP